MGSKNRILWVLFLLGSMISLLQAAPKTRQESTHSRDWLSVWRYAGGYIAAKRDRSLWRFGMIDEEPDSGICTGGFEDPVYPLTPHKIRGGKWKDISVVADRVFAIRSDGSLWGWGNEVQRGRYLSRPAQIGKHKNWKTVETRGFDGQGECTAYTMAFRKDGSLWGWGDWENIFFDFFPKHRSYDTPYKIPGRWQKVTMGCYEAYGLRKDGTLWRWGMEEKSPRQIRNVKKKKTLLARLRRLRAKISIHNIDNAGAYESRRYKGVRKNGTLWLEPTVRCKR